MRSPFCYIAGQCTVHAVRNCDLIAVGGTAPWDHLDGGWPRAQTLPDLRGAITGHPLLRSHAAQDWGTGSPEPSGAGLRRSVAEALITTTISPAVVHNVRQVGHSPDRW